MRKGVAKAEQHILHSKFTFLRKSLHKLLFLYSHSTDTEWHVLQMTLNQSSQMEEAFHLCHYLNTYHQYSFQAICMHIFRCFHRKYNNLEAACHQTYLFLVICKRPQRSRFGHCSSISYSYTFLLHTLLSTYCKMFLKGFLHWVNLFSPTSRQSFKFFGNLPVFSKRSALSEGCSIMQVANALNLILRSM